VDVRERIEPEAAPRCPYCHDMLEEVALVVCGACGTRHHAACMDELGRCTVLGCTWTPPGAAAPARFTGARTVEDWRRSVRERARAFVQGHAAPPGEPPARHPRPALRLERERPWGPERSGPTRLELLLLLVIAVPAALAVVGLITAVMYEYVFGP
jgi:hypothetical protein